MRFTNRLNLPQPLVKAVTNDGYTKGDCDISVTSLLKPPQLLALEKRHAEEITEDVSDRIWSLLGQTIHGILERAEETAIAERRLYIDINGWRVGGQMDRFVLKEGLLQDYKFTSVYKVRDGITEEFAQQLNIYAYILRKNGEAVKKLQIVAILRDWSKNQYNREGYPYPEHQIQILDVPIIDDKEVEEFISERVKLHQEAEKQVDSTKLVPCTKEERWAKDDVYAVMKEGQKRAVRLTASQAAADMVLSELDKKHYVEYREGESIRCESYCPAKSFCNQYKKMKGNNK